MIARPWAFWRRVQYCIGFLLLCLITGVGFYFLFVKHEPTCTDGIQNAEEHGIDCGGACKRICEYEILVPKATWSKSFRVTEGQYNAVAYIENKNTSIGTPRLLYTFKLYDDDGLIISRTGETVLPPDSIYPVFEGRIMTGDRIPTKTTIEFAPDITWLPAVTGRDQFELRKRDLTGVDSKPRLVAQMVNTSREEARDIEIIATIFDSQGNALTTSRTVVDRLTGGGSAEAVFTWPEPIAKTLRSCEIPTDVMLAIDLSGSMNNDGGNPPEPVSSVLTAAQSFVSQLHPNDQIGLVTYATNGKLDAELTKESARIKKRISTLTIDPKEERGSTNIGDAIKLMRESLISTFHNEEARKIAILLTDGLATAPEENPSEYAQQEAELLKVVDTEVFTIGLGKEVNTTFLTSIASSPAHYFSAPSITELEKIYSQITKSICEDGPTVIEIIPKAKTSFGSY